jgi:hypothetical protein
MIHFHDCCIYDTQLVKFKVKVTLRLTVSQAISLGVEPHLGLMTRYLLLFESYGLVFWGILSDERKGLFLVYAASPRQLSLSRIRVPWASWPYFIVSDLRLPFSSPPTTRNVTVEVFETASTGMSLWHTTSQSQSQSYVTTDGSVGQSVLE